MPEKNYVIVDIGTGNSRVALVSQDGTIHDLISFENKYYKDLLYDDARYFNPAEWKAHILGACKTLLKKHDTLTVAAVSSSGARESIVCYDENANAFLGLPNIDNRGRKWMDEIPDKAYIYKKTGRWVTEDFPAAKIMGVKKMHEDVFARIKKITSVSEWIAEIFTEKIVIEPSQACETQLYDLDEKRWSEKLCELYKIPKSILPEIRFAGTSLGTVSEKVQRELGIASDAEFIIGGADTQIAAKAAGICADDVCIVSGTTSPIIRMTAEKYHDEKERCWTNANLGGKTYIVETNPGVTGNNYQRFKNMMFPELSYEKLDELMSEKKQFLCTASFSSLAFSQKRSLKKGGFVSRAPFDAHLDKIDLCYAVLADIACSICEQYRNLCEIIPHKKDYILGCGGGFRSELLRRMISGLTGQKLIFNKGFEQAAVLGCVALCNEYFGVENTHDKNGGSVFDPADFNTDMIRQYYEAWQINRDQLNPSD